MVEVVVEEDVEVVVEELVDELVVVLDVLDVEDVDVVVGSDVDVLVVDDDEVLVVVGMLVLVEDIVEDELLVVVLVLVVVTGHGYSRLVACSAKATMASASACCDPASRQPGHPPLATSFWVTASNFPCAAVSQASSSVGPPLRPLETIFRWQVSTPPASLPRPFVTPSAHLSEFASVGTKPGSSPWRSSGIPLDGSQYTAPANVSRDPAAGLSASRSSATAPAMAAIGVPGQRGASLASDASNLARADFAGSVCSHASSSKLACLNWASACLRWQVTTDATSFARALVAPSVHWAAGFPSGKQPGSSPPNGTPARAGDGMAMRTKSAAVNHRDTRIASC
jgi:hypothetical protein